MENKPESAGHECAVAFYRRGRNGRFGETHRHEAERWSGGREVGGLDSSSQLNPATTCLADTDEGLRFNGG